MAECAICLERVDYHMHDTDCWHQFHLPCLLRWGRPSCPVCRREEEGLDPGCVIRRVTGLVPEFGRARFALMRALYASKRGLAVPPRIRRRVLARGLPEPMRLDVLEICRE